MKKRKLIILKFHIPFFNKVVLAVTKYYNVFLNTFYNYITIFFNIMKKVGRHFNTK